MFPSDFDYYRASSVEEAVELLAEHQDAETQVLAGGHSLLPTMKSGLASPDVVVDISDISELTGVTISDDSTTIGAGTTYVDVLAHPDITTVCPDLAETLEVVGDRQVRNAGTVGGNLAHADPASDIPGVAVAADADLRVAGPDGERTVPAEDFFIAMYTTALEATDLLTEVEFPNVGATDGAAYVKKSSPSSGYAMIGVAARLGTDGDVITEARLAANGAFDHPQRLTPVEDALIDTPVDAIDARAVADHATDGVESWELMDDIQVSGEFRAHLLEVYTGRAIERSLERLPTPQTV